MTEPDECFFFELVIACHNQAERDEVLSALLPLPEIYRIRTRKEDLVILAPGTGVPASFFQKFWGSGIDPERVSGSWIGWEA